MNNALPVVMFYLKKEYYLGQYFRELCEGIAREGHYRVVLLHHTKVSVDTKSLALPAGVASIDISHMGIRMLSRQMKGLHPVLLVFSGFRTLFDYTVFSTAKTCGIKTLFIEHGLIVNTGRLFRPTYYLRFLHSYFTIGCMLFVGLFTGHSRLVMRTLMLQMKSRHVSRRFDYLLVYSRHSLRALEGILDTKHTTIVFSGFPLCETNGELQQLRQIQAVKQIVYIHQPLVEDNLVPLSLPAFCEILQKLGGLAEQAGYRFLVKLHPRADITAYQRLLGAYLLLDTTPTSELIASAALVVGHFSSALLYASYLERPVLKLSFPGLKVRGDEIFDPLTTPITGYNDFIDYLSGQNNPSGSHSKQTVTSFMGTGNTHEERIGHFLGLLSDVSNRQ